MTSPSAMTYTSLRESVEEYAERHDEPFLHHIPRFIMLAENRIASEVRGLGMLKAANGLMHGAVLQKPTRWRETASIQVTVDGQRVILKNRSYEYCRFYAPDASVTGTPRFYAEYDYEHWLIVPTPADDYNFEVLYFERPEPLSDSNQVNWTTQYAPQLILYAALLEAQPFLKLDGRIATFQAFYEGAAAAVTNEAKRRVLDRTAVAR